MQVGVIDIDLQGSPAPRALSDDEFVASDEEAIMEEKVKEKEKEEEEEEEQVPGPKEDVHQQKEVKEERNPDEDDLREFLAE